MKVSSVVLWSDPNYKQINTPAPLIVSVSDCASIGLVNMSDSVWRRVMQGGTILSFPLHREARIVQWTVAILEGLGSLRKEKGKKKKKSLHRLATRFALESPHTLLNIFCLSLPRLSPRQCKKFFPETRHGPEHEAWGHGDSQGRNTHAVHHL